MKQDEPQADRNIDGVICPGCGRRVTPRLSFKDARPSASWCPCCGAKISDFDLGALLVVFVLLLFGLAAYYAFW